MRERYRILQSNTFAFLIAISQTSKNELIQIRIIDKIQTAAWLLTRHGDTVHRLRLHRKFRQENHDWIRTSNWKNRIQDAVASPDNAYIPRVHRAGQIINGELIMHNGLRVGELSYDGEGPRNLMVANRGVHEPQEERVFQEVLRVLPPGSVMLELGSSWAFYSMWFYREVAEARCFCVEPAPDNLPMGQKNFALNFGEKPARVQFEQAYVDATDDVAGDGTPILSVDSLMAKYSIVRLAILHADTQGHEVNVLLGAQNALAARTIDYIFLSTHTNELHRKCLARLKKHRYVVLADVDLLETFSFDGLIVARREELEGPGVFSLSRKGL